MCARLARQAGDREGDQYWTALVCKMDEMIWQAVHAGFAYFQAVAALVSQHLEEALTARFGLEWTARDDGHGFEIKGITGEMMRVFSSRRESITADVRVRAARFEQRYGRAPSQRELARLAQASNFATRAAKHGALDVEQAHAGWADKLTRPRRLPSVRRAIRMARPRPRERARRRTGCASASSRRARAGARGAEGSQGPPCLQAKGRARQPPKPGSGLLAGTACQHHPLRGWRKCLQTGR
jgi:TrwC relaxase